MAAHQTEVYTIWCVLEDDLSMFSVEIGSTKTVENLKEKIKEKVTDTLANIVPFRLRLYRFEIPNFGGMTKDAKEDAIQKLSENQIDMDARKKLANVFEGLVDGDDTIVLVRYPISGHKRKHSADPEDAVPVRKPRLSSPVAGVSESTSRRESTVGALYDRLNRHRFVLVRGTPASGKSTLAELLADYIHNKEPEVDPIVIDGWARSTIPVRWSLKLTDRYKKDGLNIIIIDEAQLTYWDNGLWNSLFKPIIAGTSINNDRVILFASYGSPKGRVIIEGTPCLVPDLNRVSLQPIDHNDQITPVGILLTHTEFADVVKKTYPSGRFEQDFLDYVFHVTAGHAGAVTDLLRIVKADNSYRNLKYTHNTYSLEIFHSEFSIHDLWSGLNIGSIFRRGLPSSDELRTPSTARVFRAVLINNSVTDAMMNSTEDQEALDECFKNGWLHATRGEDQTVYIFVSPLHRWFVEYYLATKVATVTPSRIKTFLPLQSIKVIQKFSRPVLFSRKQMAALNNQQLPEAQFQDEFYRCCYEYTNGSLFTFPEFGGKSGQIDFYIPLEQWGVELLRDGDRLESHSSRFTGPGAYAQMTFKDYIILDFRTTPPQKEHPTIPNLYHIVFDDHYASVTILKGSSLELITEFELLNA